MVNLLDYYKLMAASDEALCKKIDTVFKYVRNKDVNFIHKSFLSFKEIIFNSNVSLFSLTSPSTRISFSIV